MKILVAEDEPNIALLYEIMLKDRGHEVMITSNGEECVSVYESELRKQSSQGNKAMSGRASPYDAIILDYRMPKKDGLETAKLILAKNPNERIIFASAYVKETLLESIKHLGQIVELLQKPFEISELVDVVEDSHIYKELEKINVKVKELKGYDVSHSELRDLLEGLKKLRQAYPMANAI